MNPQAMLNYLLGTNEGLVMYSIYSDYANKLQGIGTGKGFDINEDGYVPKSYNTIADFTGLEYDTVRRCVDRLIKKGLLQKKPGNVDTYNIPLYRPEFKSSVFIELAKEKLADKRNARDEKNKNQAERLIPEIISTFENDSHVLVALGLVKSSQETKSFQEPKSPEEKDLNTIVEYFKYWYKKIYNKDYNPNDIETKKLRNIMNNYSIEQLGEMISIFIERYNERWKSSEYPEPTIFGLTQDWIIKQVYSMYEYGVKYEEEERQRESQLKKCISWDDL
jgi:DNA-binding Lrp family transcriptional regulator